MLVGQHTPDGRGLLAPLVIANLSANLDYPHGARGERSRVSLAAVQPLADRSVVQIHVQHRRCGERGRGDGLLVSYRVGAPLAFGDSIQQALPIGEVVETAALLVPLIESALKHPSGVDMSNDESPVGL